MKRYFIFVAIMMLMASGASAAEYYSSTASSVAASGATYSAIPSNMATNVQTAIKNASTYDFYDHTAHSVYSGTTSTGAAWTVCPTCEVTLETFTIPGGSMGPNGTLSPTIFWDNTAGSNQKTIKVRLGGTQINSQVMSSNNVGQMLTIVRNRNSESSQIWMGAGANTYTVTAAAASTASINTSQTLTLAATAITSLETGQTPTTGSSGDGATCTISILPAHGYNSGEYIQSAGGSNCATSGNPNGDPALISVTSTTQFTYSCTCNGNMQSTFPTIKRYSVIQLESVDGSIKYRP